MIATNHVDGFSGNGRFQEFIVAWIGLNYIDFFHRGDKFGRFQQIFGNGSSFSQRKLKFGAVNNV